MLNLWVRDFLNIGGHLQMNNKTWVNIGIKADTFNKLKAIKEVHGITYDQLIKELLEKFK
ncbi:hypothetical protein LCGC14_2609610 [marine sediment metagenome]|uniref:Uncharacterized protein n=1 Tax=marine sediment metagenome TaxID=412755 RepID=A0A0F9ATW2_9ZZZZ